MITVFLRASCQRKSARVILWGEISGRLPWTGTYIHLHSVDFYGKCIRKYTSPIDHMGIPRKWKMSANPFWNGFPDFWCKTFNNNIWMLNWSQAFWGENSASPKNMHETSTSMKFKLYPPQFVWLELPWDLLIGNALTFMLKICSQLC